jgi:hypothetical protein
LAKGAPGRTWPSGVAEHPREDLRRARPADLSLYGIDPARARFADYCDAFDVPSDGI